MPIEILRGDVAVATLKSNLYSGWPARTSENNRVEPRAMPNFAPSFAMHPGETIFTIGSCFARNVENALIDRGFVLPTREVLQTVPEFAAIGPSVLNNFGVPSIYNEISWALDEGTFVAEDSFFEIEAGRFVDVHLNHGLRPAPYQDVVNRRAAIRAAYREIARSRVVIITLGLTECWYDRQSQLYLNTAPRRQLVRSFPDRFELHVLNYAETHDFLKRTMTLIRERGLPEVRVILTVSPVPLTSTHRDQDVMVANMYSKSVLRAASEEIVSEFDFVDYFPSFESVLTSDRQIAWEDDLVHVQKQMIDLNISRMVDRYVVQEAGGQEAAGDLLIRLKGETAARSVFMELERRQELLPDHPELALMYATAAVNLRRPAEARSGLAMAPQDYEPQQRLWLEAQLAFQAKDYAAVIGLLAGKAQGFAKRQLYWRMVLDSYFQLGRIEDCRKTVAAWAHVTPASSEPFRAGAVVMGKAGEIQDAEYMFRKAWALTPRDADALALDYGEFLADQGRIVMARKAVEGLKPSTPGQAVRLEELMLRIGKAGLGSVLPGGAGNAPSDRAIV
jgi:hypothetical protein